MNKDLKMNVWSVDNKELYGKPKYLKFNDFAIKLQPLYFMLN